MPPLVPGRAAKGKRSKDIDQSGRIMGCLSYIMSGTVPHMRICMYFLSAKLSGIGVAWAQPYSMLIAS